IFCQDRTAADEPRSRPSEWASASASRRHRRGSRIMGLDVALGVLILLAAVRGWFKGFFLQAIGLGALVSCVYLADPLRDFARPHAAEYLPAIRPELLDRLLWWTCAVVAYLVIAGVGRGLLKASRRRPYGEIEPNRGDQGAGFALGAL